MGSRASTVTNEDLQLIGSGLELNLGRAALHPERIIKGEKIEKEEKASRAQFHDGGFQWSSPPNPTSQYVLGMFAWCSLGISHRSVISFRNGFSLGLE